jgi:2-polyprenyl-3-methyl-5-hydroxy-6-metoxy-1,4-benzoquinol methylase
MAKAGDSADDDYACMTETPTNDMKTLQWEAISQDYFQHRPGYPNEFFVLLQCLGIGMPGQEILDLGSGTGALAVPFAKQGAHVTAVDRSEGQIHAGRQAAQQANVNIVFKVASAEATDLPDHSFDVISASMCWSYFDMHRMEVEVPRLLRSSGMLLIASLRWISDDNPVAIQTEKLIAKYNPEANRAARGSRDEIIPAWSLNSFRLKTYHEFKADLLFSLESWRGRLRASKWIGAALSQEQTAAFDREHQTLLERISPAQFNICHRICIQVFEPIKS